MNARAAPYTWFYSGYSRCTNIFVYVSIDTLRGCVNKKAVLSQGERRDAAVISIRMAYVSKLTTASYMCGSLPQHGFLADCLQTAASRLSETEKY